MATLLVFYTLIILALVGIAIYEHITISTLSLPISPLLTILTILLPILSPFTTLSTPHLLNPTSQNRNRKLTHPSSSSSHPTTRSTSTLTTLPPPPPPPPPLLQFTLTVALTTLYTSQLTSPTTSSCLLSQRWLSFWKSHDAPAIRAIQDALACCGFRSTRDMAWPFPGKGRPDTGLCEAQFGRREPCLPAWEGVMRRAVGGEVGVVVCVGLLQVLVVVLGTSGRGRAGWTAGLERFWPGGINNRVGGGREGVEGSRRPLLAAAAEEDAEDGRGYREVVNEEDEEDGQRDDGDDAEQRARTGGYGGAVGGGPRVEVAHHGPWADA